MTGFRRALHGDAELRLALALALWFLSRLRFGFRHEFWRQGGVIQLHARWQPAFRSRSG